MQRPINRGDSSSLYRHLLWFTLGYAAIAFLIGLVISFGDGLFAIAEVSLLVACIELVGIWSVFGTGGYLKRMGIAHAAGIVIAAGFFWGTGLNMINAQYGPEPGDFVFTILSGFLLIPPISVAVQLPFWFFRAAFGWQFVPAGCQASVPFTIRELFTFTFVAALAFATPQMFAKLQVERNNNSALMVSQETEQVTNADGTVSQVNRKMTPEEIDQQQRSYRRQIYGMYLGSAVSSAVTFFIVSALAVPVVLFMFRPTEIAAGCLFSFLYSIAICAFILLLVAVLNGGTNGNFIEEIFGYIALAVAITIGFGSLPFMATRSAGFRLTSPKRDKRASSFSKQSPAVPSSEIQD